MNQAVIHRVIQGGKKAAAVGLYVGVPLGVELGGKHPRKETEQLIIP